MKNNSVDAEARIELANDRFKAYRLNRLATPH